MIRHGARSLTVPTGPRARRSRRVEILREDGAPVLTRDGYDGLVVRFGRKRLVHTDDVVPQRAQVSDGPRCDVQIREQPHATADVRSLASQAPYFAAW
jgi:hypothetical protein